MELKIGGVPEHFNMPWQLLLSSGALEDLGINPTWTDYHGGTGLMAEALDKGDLDIGILLTEGAVQGIDSGKQFKLLSFYIDSPLKWGIHVPSQSKFTSIYQLEGQRYAISRYGSGSHLMAVIDAQARGWSTENMKFEVVDNLNGAIESFAQGQTDIFFWEKFTTKHLVDSGEFRRLAVRKTPFSCFVICVSDKAMKDKSQAIYRVVQALFSQVNSFVQNPDRIKLISDFYELSTQDVEDWIKDVKWTSAPHLNQDTLLVAINTLRQLNLISDSLKVDDLSVQSHGLEV